jgi:uncharacterized OB-fold protein
MDLTLMSSLATTLPPVKQVPVVDFLVLGDGPPHLVGNRCAGCGATYLERRNACAACGGTGFAKAKLADRGIVESFTVVHRGAPKQTGPFVSALVRLDDGAYVKANLLDVPPESAAVDCTAAVRLRTFSAGTDDDGTEAIAFGFAYERDDAT